MDNRLLLALIIMVILTIILLVGRRLFLRSQKCEEDYDSAPYLQILRTSF